MSIKTTNLLYSALNRINLGIHMDGDVERVANPVSVAVLLADFHQRLMDLEEGAVDVEKRLWEAREPQ